MSNYKQQVSLLLQVLPEVAKEPIFALHGGTAINLFVRDMPRLSVDIDLTYIPIEDRKTSFKNIIDGLDRIKTQLEKMLLEASITLKRDKLKLQITTVKAQIKLEVNQINRGIMDDTVRLPLCEKTQEEFDAFCAIPVVPLGQLYGGKICAALDRQHPRDLFDVKYLLENEGFTEEIKKGFILFLLSSNRPLHEMLHPHFIDQRETLINQFDGMSPEPFTYEDFEKNRKELIKTIYQNLTDKDKEFLLSFGEGTPNWAIYDFERFPAVQWKLRNLVKLKNANPEKHEKFVVSLKEVLC
ncbi:nucleotidyl transferase AbiEii/AbiGii toxin family protein [Maribacter polysiphoniae]|uniref:Nucleotidyl transferase AbiEii/AbiGii toxin family protein n=1 Tax=Maribacter polysiphoniae TaxID=429344 RepID=A0A316DU17_9FLAO|nr:nucleotidyl transferase AbiEii/AbiGii toxin family protein [Maribacter polysiphoniae]MBD1262170.1 nucleotidyl transferase AbiEii/AbiGii toxin family protein [Maribacter polysiphoniae]PWK21571.1 putative nucleotidyltransferase component of viral defense system [Maribacter polysiphoniae]